MNILIQDTTSKMMGENLVHVRYREKTEGITIGFITIKHSGQITSLPDERYNTKQRGIAMKRVMKKIIFIVIMMFQYIDIQNVKVYAKPQDQEYTHEKVLMSQVMVNAIQNIKVEIFTRKLEEFLQNNFLEEFQFQEAENAICIYLSTKHDPFDMYVFAVYKEEVNGNIVREKSVYVSKESGNIYKKEEKEMILLETDVIKGIVLPDESRQVWNYEEGSIFEEKGEEIMDKVAVFLRGKEGIADFKIMYYGSSIFSNRRYHNVYLVEESDTNIHVLQRYYIDDQSLKIYKEPEDWYADTEIELYYIGNLEK